MIKHSLAALAFSATILAFSQAGAGTITVTAGPNAPFVGTTETFDGDGQTAGTAPVNDAFASYSGTGLIENSSLAAVYQQPIGSTGNYLAVLGGNNETINFNGAPVQTVGLLWGTIDSFNHLQILGLGGTVLATINGADVTATDNGTVTDYVTLTGYGQVYGLNLISTNTT